MKIKTWLTSKNKEFAWIKTGYLYEFLLHQINQMYTHFLYVLKL